MRLSLSPKILIHVPDASFSRIYGRHFASLLYALAALCIYIFLAFQKKKSSRNIKDRENKRVLFSFWAAYTMR
jgi:hypothetical protein